MDISIVIPCLNESENIMACLNSLYHQEYPSNKYEIIVVDNGSTDRTVDMVLGEVKRRNNIKLLCEKKRGTAAARNAGIMKAAYDYIAFIDADCTAPRQWLSVLTQYYGKVMKEHDNLAAVGGANLSPTDARPFIKAIDIAMDSYLGSFNSVQGRKFHAVMPVQGVSTVNALYDKSKIQEIGYFDETLRSEAEDADLNYRMRAAGHHFVYIPSSFVWHKMRSSPFKLLKNMFRYGKGRARLLKRYPRMWSINYVLPLVFILGFVLIPFTLFSNIFLAALAYFPAILIYSVYLSQTKGALRLSPYVTLVYVVEHFGYAAGELYGLIHPGIR